METCIPNYYMSEDELKTKYLITDEELKIYLERHLIRPVKIANGKYYFTDYTVKRFVEKYLKVPEVVDGKKDVIYIRVSRETVMKDEEDGGVEEVQTTYSHNLAETYTQFILNTLSARHLVAHNIYVDYVYNDNVVKPEFEKLLNEIKEGKIRRIYVPNDYLFGFNAMDDIQKILKLLNVEVVVIDINQTVLENCRTIVTRLETRNFWKNLLHFILVEGRTRNWINEYGRRLAVDKYLSKYYNIENVKLKNQISKTVKRGERSLHEQDGWQNFYR